MYLTDNQNPFPPLSYADAEGLLAIGGHISRERLLEAYGNGIFPWYEEGPVLWWSPDPRMVLFPGELVISSSMQKIIRQNKFHFSLNTCFEQVIHCCKTIPRKGQTGTWITDELEAAFIELHHEGYAISGEVWHQNELTGGIYGLLLGKVFFAESMFSLQPNASKYGLIQLVQYLKTQNIQVIDCQVYSSHLASMGARLIDRKIFADLVARYATY